MLAYAVRETLGSLRVSDEWVPMPVGARFVVIVEPEVALLPGRLPRSAYRVGECWWEALHQ